MRPSARVRSVLRLSIQPLAANVRVIPMFVGKRDGRALANGTSPIAFRAGRRRGANETVPDGKKRLWKTLRPMNMPLAGMPAKRIPPPRMPPRCIPPPKAPPPICIPPPPLAHHARALRQGHEKQAPRLALSGRSCNGDRSCNASDGIPRRHGWFRRRILVIEDDQERPSRSSRH
jgi:hypothetical protein